MNRLNRSGPHALQGDYTISMYKNLIIILRSISLSWSFYAREWSERSVFSSRSMICAKK